MNFLCASYLCASAVSVYYRRREIELLVVDEDDKLPKPRLQQMRDREHTHALAWAGLRITAAWCALFLACAHVYDTMRTQRRADIDAAWMTPLPHGCGDPSEVHEPLGYTQALVHVIYPLAAEHSCAAHLARRTASYSPNPLPALVDAVVLVPLRTLVVTATAIGEAWESFIGHFSFLQQSALIPVIAVMLMLLVVLAPSFGCIRAYAVQVRQAYTSKMASREEGESVDFGIFKEVERTWDQQTMRAPSKLDVHVD